MLANFGGETPVFARSFELARRGLLELLLPLLQLLLLLELLPLLELFLSLLSLLQLALLELLLLLCLLQLALLDDLLPLVVARHLGFRTARRWREGLRWRRAHRRSDDAAIVLRGRERLRRCLWREFLAPPFAGIGASHHERARFFGVGLREIISS